MVTGKEEVAPAAFAQEVSVPEWDTAGEKSRQSVAGHITASNRLAAIRTRFNTVLPADRRYVGMTRRVCILVSLAICLIVLALILGLAIGLSRRSRNETQDLPLPSNTATFTGDLTYYSTGLGACGETSADTDYIVAVSWHLFDAAGSTSSNGGNSNANPLCGRKIRAQRTDARDGQQKSVDLRVVDRCTGCAPTDIDTTITVFTQLAAEDLGRVDVTWAWLPS